MAVSISPPLAQVPPPSDAISDSDGRLSPIWYRWFYTLFQQLQSGFGVLLAKNILVQFLAATQTQTDVVIVGLDNGLTLINQTSDAGSGGGTLTNAPHAGNPTFWLRIQINGVSYAVPLWAA